jgi:hypothetical protein
MDSPLDLIHQGFTEELWKQKIVEERPPELSNEELIELGRRAASYAVAPLLCSTDIGDRWDARRVTEFLDVSRQAVYKRVRTGSLLGLPGSDHMVSGVAVRPRPPRRATDRGVDHHAVPSCRP